jgi:protein SCO1/2
VSRPRLLALLLFLAAGSARAQTTLPAILREVGIDQHLGQQIPQDLTLKDESGHDVRLADLTSSRRPAVLALVYYRCPMLCTMVLNDLLRGLKLVPLDAGKDFDVIAVSFDPGETPDLASKKRDEYVRQYARARHVEPAAVQGGWHFLTGDADSIRRLTSSVGFRYVWDEKYKQFIHASGVTILTPDLHLARYFYGIDYEPKDLRLSLVEASGGKIGSRVDQALLYCFHYDPAIGKYTPFITNFVRAAGVLTVLALGAYVVVNVRRERRTAAPGAKETEEPVVKPT